MKLLPNALLPLQTNYALFQRAEFANTGSIRATVIENIHRRSIASYYSAAFFLFVAFKKYRNFPPNYRIGAGLPARVGVLQTRCIKSENIGVPSEFLLKLPSWATLVEIPTRVQITGPWCKAP